LYGNEKSESLVFDMLFADKNHKRQTVFCFSILAGMILLSLLLCFSVYFYETKHVYPEIIIGVNKTLDINQIIGHSAEDVISEYGDFYSYRPDKQDVYSNVWVYYSVKGRRSNLRKRYLEIYFDENGIATQVYIFEHSGEGG
jgi:hypothetical protein